MALEYRDRVSDYTSDTGTGTVALAGTPPVGFRDFTAHTTGATVRYLIISADSSEWEVGQGIWTTSGATLTRDTVYASSNAGALVNFSAGTKAVSSVMTAADAPAYVGCKAYNNGTQTVANATATLVTFGAEEWDTDGIHSTSSNTSRFTVPAGKAGKWQFSWRLSFAAATGGARLTWLRKNAAGAGSDTDNVIGSGDYKSGATIGPSVGNTMVVDLAVSDYVEVWVYQDSGISLNIGASTGGSTNAVVSTMEARFLG